MKQYLKMADVFKKEVLVEKSIAYTLKNELDKFYRAREVNDDTLMCSGDGVASYAAHAINSHDELVRMNHELLAALEQCAKELTWMIAQHNEQNMEDGSWKYDHQTPWEAMQLFGKSKGGAA